jgi:hypothetical protein
MQPPTTDKGSEQERPGSPRLAVLVAITLILTLTIVVAPVCWGMARALENALVQDKSRSLQLLHAELLRQLETRLFHASASVARLGRMLTDNRSRGSSEGAAEFEGLVAREPDGCWRSRRERFDHSRDAGIWLPPKYQLDDRERTFLVEAKRSIELYQTRTSDDFFNTWLLPRTGGEIAFAPAQPTFIRDLTPETDYTTTDWVTLADPSSRAGRQRATTLALACG